MPSGACCRTNQSSSCVVISAIEPWIGCACETVIRDIMGSVFAKCNCRRVMRFAFVGGMNTIIAYGAYAALLGLGVRLSMASLGSLVVGIFVGFSTQGALVFGNATIGAFARFVAVWAAIYCSYLAIVLSAQEFGLNNYLGGLVALPVVTALSYFLQSRFVFRNRGRR